MNMRVDDVYGLLQDSGRMGESDNIRIPNTQAGQGGRDFETCH